MELSAELGQSFFGSGVSGENYRQVELCGYVIESLNNLLEARFVIDVFFSVK
jgi:hypothetical protein